MELGQLQTTLYADDTYLSLFNILLISLENRVNTELITIDHWLRKKSCH